jgi:DNA-binding response OmpR family regulator
MPSVLHVEDDRGFNAALAATLGPGFDLALATTLQEAIVAACTRQFDGCLLDLNLPDSEGFATFQKFRCCADVPVIVVTAIDDDQLALKVLRSGAKDFFGKDKIFDAEGRARLARSIRWHFGDGANVKCSDILALSRRIHERVLERCAISI